MVAMRTAAQSRLEFPAVFSEIVQEPGSSRDLSTADRFKKSGRAVSGFDQMLPQRMPLRFVQIAAMCVVWQVLSPYCLSDAGLYLPIVRAHRSRAGRGVSGIGSAKGHLVAPPARNQP